MSWYSSSVIILHAVCVGIYSSTYLLSRYVGLRVKATLPLPLLLYTYYMMTTSTGMVFA